jgi:hypothetical protein
MWVEFLQVIGKTARIQNLCSVEGTPSGAEYVCEAETLLVWVPGTDGRCSVRHSVDALGKPEGPVLQIGPAVTFWLLHLDLSPRARAAPDA